MGKGGYIGGSTIIYITQPKVDVLIKKWLSSSNSNHYICKICGKEYFGDKYFDHLREHGLEGCYPCGEPYNRNDLRNKNVFICPNCGKRTLLRLRKIANDNISTHRKKNGKKVNGGIRNKTKKNSTYSVSNKCKIISKPDSAGRSCENLKFHSGEKNEQHPGKIKANESKKALRSKVDLKSPSSQTRHREKQCQKFGVSFGDIFQKAIKNKIDNLEND